MSPKEKKEEGVWYGSEGRDGELIECEKEGESTLRECTGPVLRRQVRAEHKWVLYR